MHASPDDLEELTALVGSWLTLPEIAQTWGIPVTRVRQQLVDRELLGLRIGPRRILSVPARFVADSGPLKHLKGTVTLLSDGGLDDVGIVRWLFTVTDDLRPPGTPVDALAAGHPTPVRRLAQLLAL